MTFLAPLFLFGALLVALPILLHLRRRRAKRPQPFPSLMFLDNVPVRSVKRRRLRDVALLMARCAALLLLALAFAQPTISSLAADADEASGEQVLVLLDRSFSMSHGGRWQRALEEVRQRFGRSEDDVAVVAFASEAEVILPWGSARSESDGALIETLTPQPRTTRYAAAVRAARRLLNTAPGERPKRTVLVTDAQASGWDRAELGSLPPETEFELVDVRGSEEPINLAVLASELDRQQSGDRERVVVSARVGRFDQTATVTEEPLAVEVQLRVDDREVETKRLSLMPGEDLTEVEFQPFTVESQAQHRGSVRLRAVDGSIQFDDEHRFVLAPGDALTVVVIEPRRGAEEGFYLARALRTLADPRIRLERVGAAAAGSELVERADVIVLLDSLHELDTATSDRIEAFTRAGGGALVVVGERSVRALARGELPTEGALAPRLADGSDSGRSVRRLASFVADHPSFAAFEQGLGTAFSAVAFFRTLEFEEAGGDRAIAFLDNGSPLLVERRVGRGLVHWFGSSLDNSWTDLPLHAAYVPWLDGEVRALAGYRPRAAAYEVEAVADLRLGQDALDWMIVRPDGRRIEVAELDRSQPGPGPSRGAAGSPSEPAVPTAASEAAAAGRSDELLLRLEAPGFWEVSSKDTKRSIVLASNVAARESDDTAFDLDEFIAAVSSAATLPEETSETVVGLVEQDAPRGRLWWAIAAAALMALCVEGVLAAGRKRREQAVATG